MKRGAREGQGDEPEDIRFRGVSYDVGRWILLYGLAFTSELTGVGELFVERRKDGVGEERATRLFAALVAIVEQESISRARYFSRWLKRKNRMYFEQQWLSSSGVRKPRRSDPVGAPIVWSVPFQVCFHKASPRVWGLAI